MNELSIYPEGFWITELMDVHNALWSEFHDKKIRKEFKDDLESLDKLSGKGDY